MLTSLVNKGIEAVGKSLQRDAKQARYAMAVALTRTAKIAAEDVKKQANKDLDNPTPFTLRGFRWRKATKNKLESAVYIAPIQTEYLYYQVEGGRRRKRAKSGEAIPVNIRLNKYGNIPARRRGRVKQLMDRPDTFVGNVRGVYGIWQRGHISKSGRFSRTTKSRASNIRLLARLEPHVTYRKKFKFHQAANKSFDKHFRQQFNIAYDQALQTAR